MKEPLPEPEWYAVMTAPRREFAVEAGLRRVGYWPWLPFVRTRKIDQRKRSTTKGQIIITDQAWLSRYCFVSLRFEGDNFMDILNVPDVNVIVKSPFTGQPLRFPNSVMDELMAKGNGCGEVAFEDLVPKGKRATLEPGTIIEWREGSLLADRIAEVISDSGGKELLAMIDGKRVKVRAEHVELEGAKKIPAVA